MSEDEARIGNGGGAKPQDRAVAPEALRDAQEHHRLVVEEALDYAILVVDSDGLIVGWSPGAALVFGWTPEEIMGRPVAVTFTEEDRAHGVPAQELERARRDGSAPDVRWHVRKDGSRVFIDGVVRALKNDVGAGRGFLKIGQDVTQRRQTEAALRDGEERFRILANLVADMLWECDTDGAAAWYNERWCEYTGLTGTPDSGDWLDAVHPDEREESRIAWRESLEKREPFDREQRLRADGGEYRWFRVRSTPLRTEDGAVKCFFAATDIHELRTARDELEARAARRTAELARANEALKQEIRERARAEESRREVLRQLVGAEENERRRISRELHDSMGQLMTGLLLGLKAVGQLATGSEQLQRLEELEGLAERIARELQHMAVELRPPALDRLGLKAGVQDHLEQWSDRHGIQVDFQTLGFDDERVQPEVEAALYRIVQEGLTNVLKHANASQVSVVLERRSDMIMLIVEDDGSGFDVDAVMAALPGESGRLGLRGMAERVALFGGELTVESSTGSGTTIFVRIPLRRAGGRARAGR